MTSQEASRHFPGGGGRGGDGGRPAFPCQDAGAGQSTGCLGNQGGSRGQVGRTGEGRAGGGQVGTPTCPRMPPVWAEQGRAASASPSVRTGAARAQVVPLSSRSRSSWQPAVLPSGPEKAEKAFAIRPPTTPKRKAYRCSKRGPWRARGAPGPSPGGRPLETQGWA